VRSHGSRAVLCRFFFFFQAEDGIRDFHVTGVQTCALPICYLRVWSRGEFGVRWGLVAIRFDAKGNEIGRVTNPSRDAAPERYLRSEERRVGKECRSRGSPYD